MICPKCGEQIRLEDNCCMYCKEKIQLSYSPLKASKNKKTEIKSRIIQWFLYSSLTLFIVAIIILLLLIF